MSNPEKKPMDVAKEITENSNSDSSCSIEDREIREEVLALPALSVSQRYDVNEKIHEEAVIAAKLIVEAAKKAVEKKKTEQTVSVTGDISWSLVSKISKRPLAGGSSWVKGRELMKIPCTGLTNLPRDKPKSKCPVCGKEFKSLKAVYGHMSIHKDRGYRRSLRLLTSNAREEWLDRDMASSSSGGGLGFDLNVKLAEEKGSGSEFAWKFDLNEEPQDEEDEEKKDKDE